LVGDNLFNPKTIHQDIEVRKSLLLNNRSSGIFRDSTLNWVEFWSKTEFDTEVRKSKINLTSQGLKFLLTTKNELNGKLLTLIADSQDIPIIKYQPNINKDYFIMDCILPLIIKYGIPTELIFDTAKVIVENEIVFDQITET
jgi:hypothetical protein